MAKWFRRQRTRPVSGSVPDSIAQSVEIVPDVSAAANPLPDRDGLIWVDAAGKIQVSNPTGRDGRYAVLIVPDTDSVVVWVNGHRVVGARVVEETNDIQVRLPVQPPEAHLVVEVSADGMEAVLTVRYRPGARRHLQPSVPASHLTLDPVAKPIVPPRITLAQVQTELTRRGICQGVVNPREIESFLGRGESGSIVVARGVAPRPGAGTIEIYSPADVSVPWVVDIGTIIGRRRPDPARPGVTVTGDPRPAAAIEHGHTLRLGPGVTVMTGGLNLVAAQAGAVVQTADLLDVVPTMELDSVAEDFETLVVTGDLVVKGDIGGRHVVVTGNLCVHGDVRNATIAAGGAIVVRGMTEDSRISMGLQEYGHRFARQHVAQITNGLYDLELTIADLVEKGGVTGDRLTSLLARIIPQNFSDVLNSLRALQEAFQWPIFRWEQRLTRAVAQIGWEVDRPNIGDEDSLLVLWSLRGELEQLDLDSLVEAAPYGHADAATQFQRVQRSHLDSVGTIIIDSAYASHIRAQRVIIQGEVVGGFTTAERSIEADQLGSPSEVETTLEVTDEEGTLEAQVAFPGVVAVLQGSRVALSTTRFGWHLPPAPVPPS